MLHQASGRYADALSDFEKAITLDNSRNEAFIGAAEVLGSLNRHGPAERYFQQALKQDTLNIESLMSFGIYKFNLDEYAAAADYFSQIIAIDSFHKAAHRNLGACYEGLGEPDSALASYTKALDIEPDYVTYHNIAVVHYVNEDFKQAIDTWKKAIELNPDVHYLWGGLGFSYLNYPDSTEVLHEAFNRASELAEMVLNTNPNDTEVLNALGEYQLELQDTTKSLFFLSRVDTTTISGNLLDEYRALLARTRN